MQIIVKIFCTILILLYATNTYARVQKQISVVQLTDHMYKLTADRGGYIVNMVASVGNDGLLLVDTGEKETSHHLKAAIDTLGFGNPKIIINTHAHVDHTGGNAIFGDDPVIVAHDILRTRLKSGSYLFDEYPVAALPDITFTDSLTLYFNGEKIKLIAFPGSHDDNDILVWFTESRIVCSGDLSNGLHFPSVEEVTGNILNYREIVPEIVAILPDDVKIVSGHGEDCKREDLKTFHEAVVRTSEIVRIELDKGKDLSSLLEEDLLKEWASFGEGYVSTEEWIASLIDAFQDTLPRKTIYEPIYHTLNEKGADSAVAKYYALKTEHFGEYRFVENDLAFMALKLAKNNKPHQAIKFLELCIKEYPDGMYAYYYFFMLGNMYIKLGNKELAIKNYKESHIRKKTDIVAELLKEYDKK